jgi:2OG-Fe(II) oxygenase superfamily
MPMPDKLSPFSIDSMSTVVSGDAQAVRLHFDEIPALILENVFAPPLLERLMARCAATEFAEDDVPDIGTREVEAPQRVGRAISLLLGQPVLLRWLEQATGISPLRAVMGRLVQTRANNRDALVWHDDMGDDKRRIAVVINLSAAGFDGGLFEIRHVGQQQPLLSFQHQGAGTMMLFAVRPDLEHRVTEISSGGPRRVYTGWFLSEPEHRDDPLFGRQNAADMD